jgi:hypothetical protein
MRLLATSSRRNETQSIIDEVEMVEVECRVRDQAEKVSRKKLAGGG